MEISRGELAREYLRRPDGVNEFDATGMWWKERDDAPALGRVSDHYRDDATHVWRRYRDTGMFHCYVRSALAANRQRQVALCGVETHANVAAHDPLALPFVNYVPFCRRCKKQHLSPKPPPSRSVLRRRAKAARARANAAAKVKAAKARRDEAIREAKLRKNDSSF